MAESVKNPTRMEALENLEQAARAYTRHANGPHRFDHQEQCFLLLDQLTRAIHELDRIEGCEKPVGQEQKWQEVNSYNVNPKPAKDIV